MAWPKEMNGCQCHVPDELFFLILLKLPVRSICRFTCVSKRWLNMISSPGEVSVKSLYDQQHCKRQPYLVIENCIAFLDDAEANYTAYQKPTSSVHFTVLDMLAGKVHDKFDLPIPQADIYSIQSCHGLLCIFGKADIGYICNPSTHEFQKLPNLPFGRHIIVAGLGYLASKNEYKIVAWHARQNLGGRICCSMLTISKDSPKDKSGHGWRAIQIAGKVVSSLPLQFSTLDKCRQPLCINGVLYFWDKITRNQNQEVILCLDLEMETARRIPCPPFSCTRNFRMLEMKGRLCCADFFFDFFFKEMVLKIWERIDDVWENTYNLDTSNVRPCPVQLLAHVSADDEDGGELVLKTDEQGLVYYNIKGGSYRVPEHLAHVRVTGSNFAALLSSDSFFTLKGL